MGGRGGGSPPGRDHIFRCLPRGNGPEDESGASACHGLEIQGLGFRVHGIRMEN